MIFARDIELSPTESSGFITLAEGKVALGIADGSQDATITALLKIGAAMLERYCDTILENRTVTESFRIEAGVAQLVANYRPISAVSSLTIEDVAQTLSDFRLLKSPGIYARKDGAAIGPGWTVLVYSAGYGASGAMPEAIKRAATMLLKSQYAALSTTPAAPGAALVLSQEVADVGSETYASPAQMADAMASAGSTALPLEIRALLSPYRVGYRI